MDIVYGPRKSYISTISENLSHNISSWNFKGNRLQIAIFV
nr:MAG TPA: hypothetical protein [Bacteriophage sp.]